LQYEGQILHELATALTQPRVDALLEARRG
jgi:hypothetical protein